MLNSENIKSVTITSLMAYVEKLKERESLRFVFEKNASNLAKPVSPEAYQLQKVAIELVRSFRSFGAVDHETDEDIADKALTYVAGVNDFIKS